MKIGKNLPNPGDVDDDIVFNKLKLSSPYSTKEIEDIKYYSNRYNNAEQSLIPGPGFHKFLNENEKSSSNPNYPDEFGYHVNEFGFRDSFPNKDDSDIIAFIGCSFTFGEGLPAEENFPYIISKHLNKKSLNLGQPGTGAIRHAIMLQAAVNIWNIDTAVITLPNWSRFHYVDSKCQIKSIHLPYNYPNNSECETIRKNITMDFSDEYFLSATKDAINNIIVIAKLHNIKLVISSWDYNIVKMIKVLLDYDAPRYELWKPHEPVMPGDWARDNIHPGKNLAKVYSEKVIKTIEDGNYVKF